MDKLLIDAKQLATKKLNSIQNGLSHIEFMAQKVTMTSCCPAGVFMDFDKDERKYGVFIEIDDKLPTLPNYLHIHSGTYQCFRFDDIMLDSHKEIYPEYFETYKSGTIIETDLINHRLQCDKPIIELQYLMQP